MVKLDTLSTTVKVADLDHGIYIGNMPNSGDRVILFVSSNGVMAFDADDATHAFPDRTWSRDVQRASSTVLVDVVKVRITEIKAIPISS